MKNFQEDFILYSRIQADILHDKLQWPNSIRRRGSRVRKQLAWNIRKRRNQKILKIEH